MTCHPPQDPWRSIIDEECSWSYIYRFLWVSKIATQTVMVISHSKIEENARIFQETLFMDPADDLWCQGWPCPPNPQSGTFIVLQVWTSRMGGSWHTSNHARELKFGTHVKNDIEWWSVMSRMTPSPKTPVRNPQHPRSPQLRLSPPNQLQSWSNFQHRPIGNH